MYTTNSQSKEVKRLLDAWRPVARSHGAAMLVCKLEMFDVKQNKADKVSLNNKQL